MRTQTVLAGPTANPPTSSSRRRGAGWLFVAKTGAFATAARAAFLQKRWILSFRHYTSYTLQSGRLYRCVNIRQRQNGTDYHRLRDGRPL